MNVMKARWKSGLCDVFVVEVDEESGIATGVADWCPAVSAVGSLECEEHTN